MAIWYDFGRGLAPLSQSFARYSFGADAYLCAPGPSLADVNDADLHVPGAVVVGLTTVYPHIRPDIWVGMDRPECYDLNMWWEPCMKFCRGNYHKLDLHGAPLSRCPNTYFMDLEPVNDASEMFARQQHNTQFIWMRDTLMTALHLLTWMGMTRIHFVGFDMGGSQPYYDERELPDHLCQANLQLYTNQVRKLHQLTAHANRRGVEFISCTPDSPINKFMDYRPLAAALHYSRAYVPNAADATAKPHATEVEHVRWGVEPTAERGVIVGCTGKQEGIIPWWLDNYKKTGNTYPIMFADFGLSAEAKALCAQHGTVVDMTDIPVLGWFRKPYALLRAPFKEMIWFDVDIEIRGNVDKYFEYGEADKLGLGEDRYINSVPQSHVFRRAIPTDCKIYDTGVVVAHHGNATVLDWARLVMRHPRRHAGDHEALGTILYGHPEKFNAIPATEHRMRIEGDATGLLTFHWTGQQHKEVLKTYVLNNPAQYAYLRDTGVAKPASKLKYVIGITTCNREADASVQTLPLTIASLQRSGLWESDIDFELVIHDHGSVDQSYLDEFDQLPRCTVVRNSTQAPGHQENLLGMLEYIHSQKPCDFVLWLEDDVLVCDKWIENATAWVEAHARVAPAATLYHQYAYIEGTRSLALDGGYYGTQAIVLNTAWLPRFIAYLKQRQTTDWGALTDLLFAAWLREDLGLTSIAAPDVSLVQHMPQHSVLHTPQHTAQAFPGEDTDPKLYTEDI